MAIKKSELYSSLWKSCDELRGGMDASQYKDYVLSLLFVADMLGAILFAVRSKGFVGGFELEFLVAAASLTLALAGAGAYSLDDRGKR